MTQAESHVLIRISPHVKLLLVANISENNQHCHPFSGALQLLLV